MSDALTVYRSLLNPFNTEVLQPKLPDAKAPRTAGLRLRSVGQITVQTDGTPTYIAIFPGISNVFSYQTVVATGMIGQPAFVGHADTITNKANIKRWRCVGAAVRIQLLNSSLQNDGFWEAARIPMIPGDVAADAVTTGDAVYKYPNITSLDLSNYQTYQTGKLKDIDRYQFGLNPETLEMEFNINALGADLNNSIADYGDVDRKWDMILIKIQGSATSGSPSKLMVDSVSLQEVEYQPGTALSRLQSHNWLMSNYKEILEKTKKPTPGVMIR